MNSTPSINLRVTSLSKLWPLVVTSQLTSRYVMQRLQTQYDDSIKSYYDEDSDQSMQSPRSPGSLAINRLKCLVRCLMC